MATPSKTQKIASIRAELSAIRADKHARHDDLTVKEERAITEKVKALNSEMVATIIEGSEPCEGCGGSPHGMVQEVAIKNKPVPYFEIGCLACRDKRAQGFTPEQAVEAWNAEDYLPPKAVG